MIQTTEAVKNIIIFSLILKVLTVSILSAPISFRTDCATDYIYQIIQAAGDRLIKDADFMTFENKYITIDRFCDGLHVFDAFMTDVKVQVVQYGVASKAAFQDQKPLIINDRTMLPIRAVAEALDVTMD